MTKTTLVKKIILLLAMTLTSLGTLAQSPSRGASVFNDGDISASFFGRYYQDDSQHGIQLNAQTTFLRFCDGLLHANETCSRRIRRRFEVQVAPVEVSFRFSINEDDAVDLQRLRVGLVRFISEDQAFKVQIFTFLKGQMEISSHRNEDINFTGLEVLSGNFQGEIFTNDDDQYAIEMKVTIGLGLTTDFSSDVSRENPIPTTEEDYGGYGMTSVIEGSIGFKIKRRLLINLLGGLHSVRSFEFNVGAREYFYGAEISRVILENRVDLNVNYQRHQFDTSGQFAPSGSTGDHRLQAGVSVHW